MRFPALIPILTALLLSGCSQPPPEAPRGPNVILVMTDDQGYGDIAVHGNRVIQTPNLDRLHGESVRLTDFHVDPTCSPTRSALMTGRYSTRTGVWHTIMGRSILARDEVTLGGVFAQNGYRTGMFGKWHLGDNYPYLPGDRGFQEVVRHGGGGVGQTPDYWGNDYFDDTYWKNGEPTQYEGYCTDVFFREALRFIEENREQPFFAYIATNAPHGPFLVDERYSKPYEDQGVPAQMAAFYGMITNIDENMGRLMAKLDEWGLRENTILIFMTDNGTAAGILNTAPSQQPPAEENPPAPEGWYGFNDGMRGRKGSEYEGGHRVPFYLRWPAGGLTGGRDVDALTAHIDVLPTLAALCELEFPPGLDLDGVSLVPLLRGEGEWPERTVLVHSQRIENPEKWRKSAVMTERWRLVNGEELYDIVDDPGQRRDVAGQHAEVVAGLRGEYERWWEHISGRFDEQVHIPIGAEENPARITSHDWHPADDEMVPWNQRMIEQMPFANGIWHVEVAQAGSYRFRLYHRDKPAGFPLEAQTARIKVGDAAVAANVEPGSDHVELELDLPKGKTAMQTWLQNADGRSRGAFYVYAERR